MAKRNNFFFSITSDVAAAFSWLITITKGHNKYDWIVFAIKLGSSLDKFAKIVD